MSYYYVCHKISFPSFTPPQQAQSSRALHFSYPNSLWVVFAITMVAQKTTTDCWHTSSSRTSKSIRKTVHHCFYYPPSILPASSNQRFLDTESELWMDHCCLHYLSWTRFSNQDFLNHIPLDQPNILHTSLGSEHEMFMIPSPSLHSQPPN